MPKSTSKFSEIYITHPYKSEKAFLKKSLAILDKLGFDKSVVFGSRIVEQNPRMKSSDSKLSVEELLKKYGDVQYLGKDFSFDFNMDSHIYASYAKVI